jgi:hypothetical protein
MIQYYVVMNPPPDSDLYQFHSLVSCLLFPSFWFLFDPEDGDGKFCYTARRHIPENDNLRSHCNQTPFSASGRRDCWQENATSHRTATRNLRYCVGWLSLSLSVEGLWFLNYLTESKQRSFYFPHFSPCNPLNYSGLFIPLQSLWPISVVYLAGTPSLPFHSILAAFSPNWPCSACGIDNQEVTWQGLSPAGTRKLRPKSHSAVPAPRRPECHKPGLPLSPACISTGSLYRL